MARILFCRHTGCGDSYLSIAGVLAVTCPSCGREARWSTTPGQTVTLRPARPRVAYDLTWNDRQLLRRLGIAG